MTPPNKGSCLPEWLCAVDQRLARSGRNVYYWFLRNHHKCFIIWNRFLVSRSKKTLKVKNIFLKSFCVCFWVIKVSLTLSLQLLLSPYYLQALNWPVVPSGSAGSAVPTLLPGLVQHLCADANVLYGTFAIPLGQMQQTCISPMQHLDCAVTLSPTMPRQIFLNSNAIVFNNIWHSNFGQIMPHGLLKISS